MKNPIGVPFLEVVEVVLQGKVEEASAMIWPPKCSAAHFVRCCFYLAVACTGPLLLLGGRGGRHDGGW